MTNNDVINAAFRIWGQELYKTTSLAKLAETLGVSKAALYRHFPDKQTLLDAMEERFYDDYAAAIKPAIEETLKSSGKTGADSSVDDGKWLEKLLSMVRFISGYFARHFDYFIYSLIKLHGSKEHNFFNVEPLFKRGVSFKELKLSFSAGEPSSLFLAGITALFGTSLFHKERLGIKEGALPKRLEKAWFTEPSEETILRFTEAITERVRFGLFFDRSLVDSLPYKELENRETGFPAPPDPLLKAVAEAVAEEGPWNASMETVAKKSGLSKSGLYAHFKSKEDMLSRLFMTEFDRIAHYTTAHASTADVREEQLYLAILSITSYLKARPEILVVLDWVRIQRLELDLSATAELFDFFAELKIGDQFESRWENVSRWILFLLGGLLLRSSEKGVDYGSLRRMFRFICLGIEGLK